MNENRGIWRGKRVDNGEWIDGYCVEFEIGKKSIPCIIPFSQLCNVFPDKGVYQVDPETLGECTGITDKNGKLIFEWDIVKTKKYGKIVGHSNVNDYDIFVVKYEPALFRLENHNRGFNFVNDKYNKFEVIGNIHDNPELMKGGPN